ncbi:MAG: DUF885 domain-containing protein [Myxococcales bacterium]|nr:DUF885 domain-containing protein [Myxococcales bacterium]
MRSWLVVAAVIGLAAVDPGVVGAEENFSQREGLYELFDEIWDWQLNSFPEFATHVGVPGHDDRWTDVSLEAIAQRQRDQRRFLTALEAIDGSGLDADAQLDRELIQKSLQMDIEGFQFPFEVLAINQLGGVHQNVPQMMASMSANSIDDYENRLARLRAVPVLVKQTLVLLDRGLSVGITPPRITLRDVPQQVRNLITEDAADSPIFLPFAQIPDKFPANVKARLQREAKRILVADVYPAYRGLLEYLEQTYLSGARETISQSAMPNGENWYAHNARYHTTTNLTPKEIHEIGLAEVKRIRGEMEKIIRDLEFDGSFAEFAEFLRTDPQFYFGTREEFLTAYRAICKRADPELVRLFGTLPRLPYGVKPVPGYMDKSAPTAYYQPGSLAAGRPGTFFANTYNLATRPSWEMEALSLHEAVPGHHLQIALAQELEDTHDLLKYNFYSAFVEGWGLYAESLGDEMGFYQSPYSKFGRLTYEIWRAIRLVVDTGIHALGWSREQAIDFFKQNAPKTEHDIVVEVDRYIVWPGQALAYKIGELRIQELRAQAQQRLGSTFDVRSFHDQVLLRGAMPLDVLEQRILDWVERVRQKDR